MVGDTNQSSAKHHRLIPFLGKFDDVLAVKEMSLLVSKDWADC
jgi:hypothetical protein